MRAIEQQHHRPRGEPIATMDLKDLTKLGDLSSPLELLSKRPKALAAWMEKRTRER